MKVMGSFPAVAGYVKAYSELGSGVESGAIPRNRGLSRKSHGVDWGLSQSRQAADLGLLFAEFAARLKASHIEEGLCPSPDTMLSSYGSNFLQVIKFSLHFASRNNVTCTVLNEANRKFFTVFYRDVFCRSPMREEFMSIN